MGKRGPRPRADRGSVRSRIVAFRVSEREWDVICEAARAIGVSPLEWVRDAVLEKSFKIPAQTEDEKIMLHGEPVATQ